MKVSREFAALSFHKLCVHLHGNKVKFEWNSSFEYYHMTYIEKLNKTYKPREVILYHYDYPSDEHIGS